MKSVATSVPISAPPPMPSIHTLGNSRKKTAVSYSSSLTLLCSVLFIVAIFNTMFAVLMAYKNSLVLEENLELIRENRMLIRIQNYLREYVKPSRGSFLRNVPQMEMKEIERFAKMINCRTECPPCPAKMSIAETQNNPILIVKEIDEMMANAQ